MEAQILAEIISKEKTTKKVYFANEQVDTMKDVSMPFLSENKILARQKKILAIDGD